MINIQEKLKTFISNSRHVLSVSYRPSNHEFSRSAKIIILGVLLIGVLGFVLGVVISLITTGTVSFI